MSELDCIVACERHYVHLVVSVASESVFDVAHAVSAKILEVCSHASDRLAVCVVAASSRHRHEAVDDALEGGVVANDTHPLCDGEVLSTEVNVKAA